MRFDYILIAFLIFPCWLYSQQSSSIPDSIQILLDQKEFRVEGLGQLNSTAWNLIEVDTSLARKLALKALTESQKLKSSSNEALAYNRLGRIAHLSGQFEKAIAFYEKNLVIRRATKDTLGHCNTLLNLGNSFKHLADYKRAAHSYFEAASLMELSSQSDLSLEAKIHNNLGAAYTKLGKSEESHLHYQKSLSLYRENDDQPGFANASMNYGAQLVKEGKIEKGLKYLNDALVTLTEIGDHSGVAKSLTNIGNVWFENNQFMKAIEYYDLAMDKHLSLGNRTEITRLHNNKGSAFLMLENYQTAQKHYTQGLSLAEEINARKLQAQFYENLAYLEEYQGNYQLALNWYYRFDSLSSILLNEQNNLQINELRVQYNSLKQENELRQLENKKQQQDLTIDKQKTQIKLGILTSILALCIGLLLYFGYRQKQRANIQLKKQKELIAQKEREKELLLRELNHRVKNNLQIIASMLSLQSFEQIDEAAKSAIVAGQGRIEALSLIHQKLYQTDNITHVDMQEYITRLVDNVRDSFGEQLENLNTELDIQIHNMEADLAIPCGLILNELLNNTFKHAFNNVLDPKLRLSLTESAEAYLMVLQDNGPGFDRQSSKGKGSFGLSLIEALVKQLKGTWITENVMGSLNQISFPKSKNHV